MKKALICSVLFLALLGTSTSASALTHTKTSSGQTFTNTWSLPASGTNWLMTYGFNKEWIDEDFTHTTHSVYDHTAIVSNANGAYPKKGNKGDWAKIEVRHSGSYVEYSIVY